jgi:hypothetical protein
MLIAGSNDSDTGAGHPVHAITVYQVDSHTYLNQPRRVRKVSMRFD